MKKFLTVLGILVLIVLIGTAVKASDVSLEYLFNRVFNTTSNALQIIGTDSTHSTLKTSGTTHTAYTTVAIKKVSAGGNITLVSANTSRRYFYVQVISNDPVWIFLKASADAKPLSPGCGIYLNVSDDWEMPTNAIYTGEISAYSRNHTSKITLIEY